MKQIIYKENGVYKLTNEANFSRNIRNAKEVCTLHLFHSADEIIDYLVQYGKVKREDFIVIE